MAGPRSGLYELLTAPFSFQRAAADGPSPRPLSVRRLTSPLEEPLPLPTEWVEGGDAGGRKGKIVGEEDSRCAACSVEEAHASQAFWIVLPARARGEDPAELLPAVHQVVSLAKRWLLGTHQGSVDEAHLASYLNEFVFRFNRRRSRSRGMVFYRVLELAVAHDPVRYQDLIATKRPRAVPSTPPQGRGHPPSLERPPAKRPSRTAGLDGSG